MSVQILLEAVAKIREQAEAARAGRWFVAESSLTPEAKLVVADWQNGHRRVATCAGSLPEGNAANADYIASMHPIVGLAVADWLETEACYYAYTLPRRRESALAVARALLGRDE